MKTKEITKKDKTLLEQLRGIRDKMSLEMKNMTVEQIKEYLSNKETLHPTAFWRNRG
jgi:hypothetical protein